MNEFSARLEGHRAIGLPLDHFKLNKFASPEDGNYQDVSGEVVRFYKLALEVAMARPVNRRRSSGDVEAYRRLIAKQELKLEEAAKEAALKEEEFEKRDLERLRLQEEQSAKGEAERRVKMTEDSLERLKRNMVRYGLGHRAIEAIFRQHPPPPTLKAHYPEESISEQSEWYRSTLKGVLLEAGLGEGEVDAIMHDTNDTMLINGVRTSITRMLDMWLSERTLMRYKIPYMRDPVRGSHLPPSPSMCLSLRPRGFFPRRALSNQAIDTTVHVHNQALGPTVRKRIPLGPHQRAAEPTQKWRLNISPDGPNPRTGTQRAPAAPRPQCRLGARRDLAPSP